MQEWNRQRTLAIERALTQFLYPQTAKELKSKLIAEAKENIIRVMGCDVIGYPIVCNLEIDQELLRLVLFLIFMLVMYNLKP